MPAALTVILNPAAGRGQGRKALPTIQSALPQATILQTTAPGDGVRLARLAVANGAHTVVAAGGDGTIHEVLNGIAGTKARLGLIPIGTGNDFARTWGLEPNDIPAAIHTILQDQPAATDVGKCGQTHFLNVAGCGFDAAVAERINRGFRLLRGTTAYIAAVMSTLARYEAVPMSITVDDEHIETCAMLCAVANAKCYGGGMMVAPDASLTDGLFDVVILEKISRSSFIRAFPSVFKGAHLSHPRVSVYRARNVVIDSPKELRVLVDGELKGKTPVAFECIAGGVQILKA